MRHFVPLLFQMLRTRRVAASCFLAMLLVMAGGTARADEPFGLEGGGWMSFDRYKQKPADWQSPEDKAKIPPPLAPVTAPAPVVPPVRDVKAPVMPTLNSGFDMHVDSTSDSEERARAQVKNLETHPDLQLPATRWQNAAEAARRKTKKEEESAVDVRMTYLPQLPATTRAKKMKKEAAPLAKAAPPTPEQESDAKIRAALDAYKKKELQALESDRQTLQALQDAISQLGLSKDLNFLTGASKTVNPVNTTPAPLIDIAPTTP